MARLSLWKDGKHSNDYRFIDRAVSEQFTIGGTGINIHKYLGVQDQGNTDDLGQPSTANGTETAIQDLLLLENRDRKYEPDIYDLRGHYNVGDIDMAMEQWGMMIQNDNLYMTFHLNDMVDRLGRKLMIGDVIELPHLKDFFALDDTVPVSLRRFYVIDDATRAAEGFSPTWWPHLWRVKAKPMVDAQEYSQILDEIQEGAGDSTLRDLLSTYNQEIANNAAVVAQAEASVPASGYDTSEYYIMNQDGVGNPGEPAPFTNDDSTAGAADTPQGNGWTDAYLTGDGLAPNGYPVVSATAFPDSPTEGDYVLRLDFLPNRLFRWNSSRWVKIENVERTSQTHGVGSTQRDSFVNNTNTTTTQDNKSIDQRVALSKALKPTEDN